MIITRILNFFGLDPVDSAAKNIIAALVSSVWFVSAVVLFAPFAVISLIAYEVISFCLGQTPQAPEAPEE